MDQNDALEKYRQADTLMEEERYHEALAVLDELYAAYPNEKELIYIRALCLEKVDRKQEAWGLAKRLIELHDDPRGREIQTRLEGIQQPVVPPPLPFATDAAASAIPTAAAGDPFDIGGVMAPPPPPIEVASAKSSGSTKYVIMAVVVLLLLVGATLLAVLDGGEEERDTGPAPARPAVTTAQPKQGPVSISTLGPEDVTPTIIILGIVMLVLGVLTGPIPLYLTLLFTGNLPGGSFVKVYFRVLLVWLALALFASIPCIGWILALPVTIITLHKVYDMGFIDFLILIGMSLGFGAVTGFAIKAILFGFGFVL